MKTPKAEDHLLLMFSMKPAYKFVSLEHCWEKLNRDFRKISKEEVQGLLDSFLAERFIQFKQGKKGKLFAITDSGKKEFIKRLKRLDEKKLNYTYLLVYKAKNYYPIVADTVLEFCKNRNVGFYVVFTGQRFFRRNFRGKLIELKNLNDLMFFINLHYLDVIPCVHRIGKSFPDWLVIDLDAGKKVKLEEIKKTVIACFKEMQSLKLKPVIKFSGSRGFQIWAKLKQFSLPEWYSPLPLPGGTEREKNFFSLYVDFIRLIQAKVDKKLPGLTVGTVTAKETREDKILFDYSSMKPQGLVRAPFGLHSKTGLVSLPLSLKEISSFKPELATVEKTAKEYAKRKKLFELQESNAEKLLKELKEFSRKEGLFQFA